MKILYFDCFSGISGDMTIGAFIDAGVDYNYLSDELKKLNLKAYSLKCEKISKNGLASTKFNVMDESGNVFGHAPIFAHCNKTHTHEHVEDHSLDGSFYYEHSDHISHDASEQDHQHLVQHCGHLHTHDNQEPAGEHHHHDHQDHVSEHHEHDHHARAEVHRHELHTHDHNEHSHHEQGSHQHRSLGDIKKLIDSSALNENVKKISKAVFENIAHAESKMHAIDVEKIHFHEVGAIDSIIDIVGSAICYDYLKIEKAYVSKIPISFGFINIAHGKWPNPAPASLELLKKFTLTKSGADKELVTPTGAAIIKTLCEPAEGLPDFSLTQIGYGAGFHDFEHPNVLRIMIGEKKKHEIKHAFEASITETAKKIGCLTDHIDVITANIDDMKPEYYDFLIDKIAAAGALDAAIMPLAMKKGRPSNQLSVMCKPEKTAKVCEEIFKFSTAIGMRIQRNERLILERDIKILSTDHGEVKFKITALNGKILNSKPEYEDLKKYASSKNISLEDAAFELSRQFHEK